MTGPRPDRAPVASLDAGLAIVGALALVAAAFLPWTDDGALAVDLSLRTDGTADLPTVGLVLILVAALPALAALTTSRAWPRLVAAFLVATTALAWLAEGPGGALVAGLWTALGGCVALLYAAALATPVPPPGPRPVPGP